MLDAIDAKELSSQTVMNACQYMVGECSCTVKTQNPGVDLLMSANWSESLGGDTVVIVDSQADLSPQLIEIPFGTSTVGSAASLQADVALQAADDQDASHEAGAVDENVTAGNAERSDPSVETWQPGGVLIFILAGAGMLAMWLASRSRSR